jgi:LPS-assembly lipoprotein
MDQRTANVGTAARLGGVVFVLFASFAALPLSGCGFHLRGAGSAELPEGLRQMRIASAGGAYAPLAVEMRNALSTQAGVRLVDAVDGGVPTLTLSEEHIESQVLAIDITGKVSDYLLNYRVQYSLTDAQGRQLVPIESVKLQREYTFDKLSVLAKEKEEEFLRREMQRDAVQQILRRLASLPAAAWESAR